MDMHQNGAQIRGQIRGHKFGDLHKHMRKMHAKSHEKSMEKAHVGRWIGSSSSVGSGTATVVATGGPAHDQTKTSLRVGVTPRHQMEQTLDQGSAAPFPLPETCGPR